jgi:hypothetical protein
MADFESLRSQIQEARKTREQKAAAAAAAAEHDKRLALQVRELARTASGTAHAAGIGALQLEQEKAAKALRDSREARDAAVADEAALLHAIGIFTDPRQGVQKLNDEIPILMMPVRLETRFKSVPMPRGPARPQLWLRVYPDDCWIDGFAPTLTETEVRDASAYWAGIWQADGDEQQERAAWAKLVSAHGSGRAAWIVQQFRPVNEAEKPVGTKAKPNDVILVIATPTAFAAAEADAIKAYWPALWKADGRAALATAAMDALVAAGGAARAAELAAGPVPVNFKSRLPAGVSKDDVDATAAILVLPTVPMRQSAWSHAPKVNLLPERFVFLGYASADDTNPLVQVGAPVPSTLMVAPDPSAPKEEQLRHDADGNLVVPPELLWLSDFDRAVTVGMGMRIDLTPVQAISGFHRVLVVGLRLTSDKEASRLELQTLLQHHAYSGSGIAVVPQGTPTNNTEAVGTGHDRLDDPDVSFDDLKAPPFTPQVGWLDKQDGQWLAEILGIDAALFNGVHAAGATDQRCARAMNAALWPATLGYWMETMLAPVFSRDGIEQTRAFFNRFVIGGGCCPALRIGWQPYGILPATTLSRMTWLSPRDDVRTTIRQSPMLRFLQRLYPVLLAIDRDLRAMQPQLSYVGKVGDPHALLLDIVGLHPGSVEWSQRYAESLKTVFNRLSLLGLGGIFAALLLAVERTLARGVLTGLGYGGEQTPPILDLVFSGKHLAMKGGVVDDQPLSESLPIRPYTVADKNYLQWLIDASNTSLDALYEQQGFKQGKPPTALLYLMLRHALQLGYHDVSVRLHESVGLYTAEQALLARQDDPFLHIRDRQTVSESRYQPLYAQVAAITGDATMPVHRFIAAQLPTLAFTGTIREQLAALERLKDEPTARLERVFADHIDCCSYRLDAWLLGLVNFQLTAMRNLHDGLPVPPRQGIYLGAYAWLEEVKPEPRELTPVSLTDPELVRRFGGDPPLLRDSVNQGYIHAPSLNHAVAAAVLRNGFISNASRHNGQTLAVNLTSERVRTALAMLEGIRAGQSLSDLLGYQLERGLHDRHAMAEIDKFIYKLREAFPLRANRLRSTKTAEGVPIEAIEARNVVNGLALVEHIQATGNKVYPFGRTDLPPTDTQAQADAINTEVDRLLESHDAVADLALSEGVYQAVLGNYDRVASTYDAYARGNFPPEPEVVRTPLNGIGLTHRVGLHLQAGADPTVSPVGGAPTPRGQGEPAVNHWLSTVLPTPGAIACLADYRHAPTGTVRSTEVTLAQLGLEPADMLALVRDENRQAMTELDDRIIRHAVLNLQPRPDVPVSIRYMGKQAAPFSVFEVMPLLRNLRQLVGKSRPLKSSDLALMNEARTQQDDQPVADKARLDLVRNAMVTLRGDINSFIVALEPLLADLPNRAPDIVAGIDATIAALVELLERAARFAVPQAGWGFAYDFRQRTYAAILAQCAALVARWDEKLAFYNARLAEAAAAVADSKRFTLLAQAELAIASQPTVPQPATPALYLNVLQTVKQPAFVTRRGQLAALQATTQTQLTGLITEVEALLPVSAFDVAEFSLASHRSAMVRFAEDAVRVAGTVRSELDRRLADSAARFADHAAAASPAAQVAMLESAAKALLGQDFRIVPEFALVSAQGDELENALAASRAGTLFEYLINPPEPGREPLDFPVDAWLYGLARVREKMHAWEQVMMLAGALGKPEPELEAMQLPFAPGDRWLGLEFPPDLALDSDRLLYTAHFTTAFDKTRRQCGLLLDEWTETLPGTSVDTGITFHHDRPNTEAPQVMLLLTPSTFRGAWRWEDVVGALNETLDFAKRRAIEPKHVDASPFAAFAPATVVASQVQQLTIAMNYSLNNTILMKVD